MDHQLKQLQDWISEGWHIVLFGGAGVSTEGGIPNFRSVDGPYHQQYAFPSEMILGHSLSERDPEEFHRFHRSKMLFPQVRLSTARRELAELEAAEKLTAVMAQNIDRLYQAAGSKMVYELRGSVHRNHCMKCRWSYSLDFLPGTGGVPHRPVCGGVVKPDVVLYEEYLDETTMVGAVEAIARADMLIIGGTSLAVYPAAGLICYYHGNRLALINKSVIPYDREAGLVINASLDEVLGTIRVQQKGVHVDALSLFC